MDLEQATECIYELQSKVENLQAQIDGLKEDMRNSHR